jgi:hypothetical protein
MSSGVAVVLRRRRDTVSDQGRYNLGDNLAQFAKQTTCVILTGQAMVTPDDIQLKAQAQVLLASARHAAPAKH